MKNLTQINLAFLVIAGCLILPSHIYASGIDDVANYKSPSLPPTPQIQPAKVEAYTTDEIINLIVSKSFDDKIHYRNTYKGMYWADIPSPYGSTADPRAIAFDKENFGNCNGLYIATSQYWVDTTMKFLFAETESQKSLLSNQLQGALKTISGDEATGLCPLPYDDSTTTREQRIASREASLAAQKKYVVRLKEVLSIIVDAYPRMRDMLQADLDRISAKKRLEAEHEREAEKKQLEIERERMKPKEKVEAFQTKRRTQSPQL